MSVRESLAFAVLVGLGAVVAAVMLIGGVGAQEERSEESVLMVFAGAQLRAACGLLEGVGGSCATELGRDVEKVDVGNRVLADGTVDITPQFSRGIVEEFLKTGDVARMRAALLQLAAERPELHRAMGGFDVGPDLKCEIDWATVVCKYSVRDYRGVRGVHTLRIPIATYGYAVDGAYVSGNATSTASGQ